MAEKEPRTTFTLWIEDSNGEETNVSFTIPTDCLSAEDFFSCCYRAAAAVGYQEKVINKFLDLNW